MVGVYTRMRDLSKLGVKFDAHDIPCYMADLLSLISSEIANHERESMKKARGGRG